METIINHISGKSIQGAIAQFYYRGWIVSMSQVFIVRGFEVMVFKSETDHGKNFPTVEKAIDWITSNGRGDYNVQ